MFKEGEQVTDIYIVYKGEFQMEKKLAHEDVRKQAFLQIKRGEEKPKVENLLTRKFPDFKDFPYA